MSDGAPMYVVTFEDERRMLYIPALMTNDVLTTSAVGAHVQPFLRKYKGWQVEVGRFNATGAVTFKQKHVGPIRFTVSLVS